MILLIHQERSGRASEHSLSSADGHVIATAQDVDAVVRALHPAGRFHWLPLDLRYDASRIYRSATLTDVIVVIGTFDMAPADRAEFVAQRANQVAISLTEDGCLDYALSLDAFDPGRVRLVERWIDQDALTAHVEAIRRRGGLPATITLHSRDITIIEGDVRSS